MLIQEQFTTADGQIKIRHYQKIRMLGIGAYGEVYLVKRKEDERYYALKCISKTKLGDQRHCLKMKSEIRIHKKVKHKNICDLQTVFEDKNFVYLLLQFCKNGSLYDVLQKRRTISLPEVQYYLCQIIDCVYYLHKRKIIHRDLKLGNILINDKMQLKITDFGLAAELQYQGNQRNSTCGTPNYLAPQILSYNFGNPSPGHSFEVDVWSIGVILYILLLGKAPFESKITSKLYENILNVSYELPQHLNSVAKDLISKIFVFDVAKRLTLQQIINHPFMNPKNGIPKFLPNQCLYKPVQLHIYQQNYVEKIKNTILTERRKMQDNTNQLFMENQQDQQNNTRRHRNVLKSILSTSSLSYGLEKLHRLKKTTSANHLRLIKFQTQYQNKQDHKINSIKTQFNCNIVYVKTYKRQIIWSYILSNGYIGTYQSFNQCKILYNSKSNLYFQIQNTNVKIVQQNQIQSNDNIFNRAKFIMNLIRQYENEQCSSYSLDTQLIYVKRIIEVKNQNIYVFKLSNDIIQAYNYETNLNLIITQQYLFLIKLQKDNEIMRIRQKKIMYKECSNRLLIMFYQKVKKILIKMANLGQ